MSGTFQDYLDALATSESQGTGGYNAEEPTYHYLGKYQMGEAALVDAGFYIADSTPHTNDWIGTWTTEANDDGVTSKSTFLGNSTAQEDAIRGYYDKVWSYIEHYHLDAYVGQVINGNVITVSGLLAGYHLLGIGNSAQPGLRDYLQSGGANDPQDPNHTHISTYVNTFAGYDTPYTPVHTGADQIHGSDGNDSLFGGDGNDWLVGGGGSDTLDGDSGDDTLVGGGGSSFLYGGDGTDTADYSAQTSAISVILAPSSGPETVTTTGGTDDLDSIEKILGTSLADTFDLRGDGLPDISIESGAGNDLFEVSGDAQTLLGRAALVHITDSDGHLSFAKDGLTSAGSSLYAYYGESSPPILDLQPGQQVWDFFSGASHSGVYVGVTYDSLAVGFDPANTIFITNVADSNGYYYQIEIDGVGSVPSVTFADGKVEITYDSLETVTGTGSSDTVEGSSSQDALFGGDGADTFIVTTASAETTTVGDFSHTDGDAIDITAFDGTVTSLDDMSIFDAGGNAVIGLNDSGGHQIVLDGVNAGDIDATYFLSNTLDYGAGSDLVGLSSADTIAGSSGNDSIYGNEGNDSLAGGTGDDTIYGWTENDTIHGGYGQDLLGGDQNNDLIYGESGNDSIYGGADNDTAYGGDGQDYLQGDGGADVIHGDAGNDTIYGDGLTADTLDGADTLYGDAGSDLIYGGAGDDTIHGGSDTVSGSDLLYGGDGNDLIYAENTGTTAYGDAGDDGIIGTVGGVTLYGGDGNDDFATFSGHDTIDGGTGMNLIDFESSASAVTVNLSTGLGSGGMADGDHLSNIEWVYGSAYGDTLTDGTGNDTLIGLDGADTIYGGAGNELIEGDANWTSTSPGNDLLYGGGGSDYILGDAGNDTIAGGAGSDMLYGGAGNDVFVFDTTTTVSTIEDFEGAGVAGGDVIQISTSLYANFTALSSHITYSGTTGTIALSGGHSITVVGCTNHLVSGDFTFV